MYICQVLICFIEMPNMTNVRYVIIRVNLLALHAGNSTLTMWRKTVTHNRNNHLLNHLFPDVLNRWYWYCSSTYQSAAIRTDKLCICPNKRVNRLSTECFQCINILFCKLCLILFYNNCLLLFKCKSVRVWLSSDIFLPINTLLLEGSIYYIISHSKQTFNNVGYHNQD